MHSRSWRSPSPHVMITTFKAAQNPYTTKHERFYSPREQHIPPNLQVRGGGHGRRPLPEHRNLRRAPQGQGGCPAAAQLERRPAPEPPRRRARAAAHHLLLPGRRAYAVLVVGVRCEWLDEKGTCGGVGASTLCQPPPNPRTVTGPPFPESSNRRQRHGTTNPFVAKAPNPPLDKLPTPDPNQPTNQPPTIRNDAPPTVRCRSTSWIRPGFVCGW